MSTSDSKNLAPGTYKCELCDVVCTGKDAYNAHVKGASHQKVLCAPLFVYHKQKFLLF